MKRNLLLVLLVFSLVLLFSELGFSQVNEYILDPVDLQISPVDSVVQVNININTIDVLQDFFVPLFAEGTSNPVLDTVLTGGLSSALPPAFYNSLMYWFGFPILVVNPYGPPTDPMCFIAAIGQATPCNGLYCRMFFRVTGPGTLTFRTAVHSVGGPVLMRRGDGPAPINWPDSGEVGSFEITADAQRGDANYDGKLSVADIVYLISYLFKGGRPPFVLKAGDFNCDEQTTVTDVILLLNYLFKGGPPPPC
jgi:hypothetical protein